jgi:WD40 repeat protein
VNSDSREAVSYRHDAFLSYSHAADGQLAAALQAGLQRFARPWHRLRAIRVFRDKTGLSVTPNLWGAIRRALESSEYFVLMASPEAARSHWVEQEVALWIEKRSIEHLLIVWTDGDLDWDDAAGDFDWSRSDCLPACLRGAFRTEPLYLDLRFAKTATDVSTRRPEFLDAVARLSAAIRNRPLDEMIGEDVLHHRRALRLTVGAIAALATLLVALVVAVAIAFDQRNAARAQQRVAEQRRAESQARVVQLAVATATRHTDEGDLATAALWQAEAYRLAQGDPRREATQAVRLRTTLAQQPRLALAWLGDKSTEELSFSQDGGYVLARVKGALRVWNARTGAERSWRLPSAAHTLDTAFIAPDRQLLVTAASGSDAKVVDGHGAELWSPAPQGKLLSAEFSTDGRLLVTAADDDAASVWDVASGKLSQALSHGAHLIDASISRDGQRVITVTDDNAVHVWSLKTGAHVELKHPRPILMADVSVSGAAVFTIDSYRELRLWDGDTGERRSLSPWEWNDYAAFSTDGTLGVTASRSGHARVWSAKDDREIATVMHRAPLTRAVFSPNAKLVATAAFDRTVQLWDMPRGSRALPPLYHEDVVSCLAFSPDGKQLATATSGGVMRVWDLDPGPVTMRHEDSVWYAAFQPDGPHLLTLSSWEVRLWNPRAGTNRSLPINTQIYHAAFSPDGRRVVTGDQNGLARIWDVEAGTPLQAMEHERAVKYAVFYPDGQRLLTASDGDVRGWRLGAQQPDFVLAHDAPVTQLQLAVNGRRLLTLAFGGAARVWDLDTRREIAKHQEVRRAALSQDGTRLAIATATAQEVIVRVLEADTGREIFPPIHDDFEIKRVAFSPDGQKLLIASAGGYARLWNPKTGTALTPPLKHEASVLMAAFSRDGEAIVTASADGSARVWDALTGEPLTPPLRHRGGVLHAEFSPDGRQVVSAADDNTAHVWDHSAPASPAAVALLARHAELIAARQLDATGAELFFAPEEFIAAFRKLHPSSNASAHAATSRDE